MEHLWVSQPYLRAGLLPRGHWPTQNRLRVFTHFCFVFVNFFLLLGFLLFVLIFIFCFLGNWVCFLLRTVKEHKVWWLQRGRGGWQRSWGENMIKYSIWKILIKKHLDAMMFLVSWAFAFNLPVSLCFRCVEQLIFSFYKTNDQFDYMHCNC